jgi:acyl carrier protein
MPRARTGQERGLVEGGRRWDTVREIYDGDGESLALIALPDGFQDDLDEFWLHPALLDGATAFGLAGSERQGRFLPLGYGRATLYRPLPARFYSHLRTAAADSDVVSCDVTLIGEDGIELACIEGFLLRRVEEASVRASVATRDEADARAAPAGDSGILPHEGVDVLLRILGTRPGHHLLVTPRSLDAAFERAAGLGQREVEERLKAAAPLAGTGERPASGPYVAPETEAEEFLASLWSGVLGIERVGVEDDFFELGGNSLMAVQLVTRVRDQFKIEFGIQHVLERPTVRRLAELVQERLVARLESMSDDEVRALLEQPGTAT